MSSMVTVEITVLDVNDNGPRFTAEQYNGSISERADPGSSVVTVVASDMDQVGSTEP